MPIDEEQTFSCPDCGEPILATPGDLPRLVDCPQCEERFLIPAADGSTEIPENDLPEEVRRKQREDDLDGFRMRNIVAIRRAAMRTRTYMLIGAMFSLVGAVQMVILIVQHVSVTGWTGKPIGYALGTVAFLMAAGWFMGRAAYWQKESLARKMPEPETPPDFSTLNDGSQQVKNLEEMQ